MSRAPKELPCPFVAPMVRAVQARRKTQTRRLRLQYVPGDRLWVREAFRTPFRLDHLPPRELVPGQDMLKYEADDTFITPRAWSAKRLQTEIARLKEPAEGWGRLRPAMFMCRWMSRIQLEVTDVRSQPLQSITLADAIAEGVHPDLALRGDDDLAVHDVMVGLGGYFTELVLAPVARFALLWDTLNGKTAPWSSNPNVWAYSFKVLT